MQDHPSFSRRQFLLWSLVVSAGASAVGCNTNNSSSSGTGSGAGKSRTSSKPGVLRYAIREEPPFIDPHQCMSARTWDILQNVFQPLVGYNEKSKIEPILAETMPEVSADGKTYTFKLRKGVVFHDGTPLTSDAVRINAIRVLSKELASQRATLTVDDLVGAKEIMTGKRHDLPGLQIVDDHTFRFILTEPRAYFLDKLQAFYLASPTSIAKAPKNERGVNEIDGTCAVGTGPFVLAEYRRQSRVLLNANPNYWGEKPKLKAIERPILIDAKTARNLYDTGELDMYGESIADYDADQSIPAAKAEMSSFDEAGLYFVTLNLKTFAPMKDKRVRQALSRAVDREAVTKNALAGMNQPANGFLAPGVLGAADPTEQPDALKYDPELAKKLLAEAGYTEQKPLTFTLLYSEGSPTSSKISQVLKEQWGAIGVNVTLQESEWGTMLKRMQNHEFDAMYSGWLATPDPHTLLYNLLDSESENNESGYDSVAFNTLNRAADRERDPAKREALCKKAVAVALEEVPLIPLLFARDIYLIRPYVSGLRCGLTGMLPHTTTTVG